MATISILEFINDTNIEPEAINSPRTLSAIEKLGIDTQSLKNLDQEHFKQLGFQNTNFRGEELEIYQKEKYKNYQAKKKILIDEIKQERTRIINKQDKSQSHMGPMGSSQQQFHESQIQEIKKKQEKKQEILKYRHQKEIEKQEQEQQKIFESLNKQAYEKKRQQELDIQKQQELEERKQRQQQNQRESEEKLRKIQEEQQQKLQELLQKKEQKEKIRLQKLHEQEMERQKIAEQNNQKREEKMQEIIERKKVIDQQIKLNQQQKMEVEQQKRQLHQQKVDQQLKEKQQQNKENREKIEQQIEQQKIQDQEYLEQQRQFQEIKTIKNETIRKQYQKEFDDKIQQKKQQNNQKQYQINDFQNQQQQEHLQKTKKQQETYQQYQERMLQRQKEEELWRKQKEQQKKDQIAERQNNNQQYLHECHSKYEQNYQQKQQLTYQAEQRRQEQLRQNQMKIQVNRQIKIEENKENNERQKRIQETKKKQLLQKQQQIEERQEQLRKEREKLENMKSQMNEEIQSQLEQQKSQMSLARSNSERSLREYTPDEVKSPKSRGGDQTPKSRIKSPGSPTNKSNFAKQDSNKEQLDQQDKQQPQQIQNTQQQNKQPSSQKKVINKNKNEPIQPVHQIEKYNNINKTKNINNNKNNSQSKNNNIQSSLKKPYQNNNNNSQQEKKRMLYKEIQGQHFHSQMQFIIKTSKHNNTNYLEQNNLDSEQEYQIRRQNLIQSQQNPTRSVSNSHVQKGFRISKPQQLLKDSDNRYILQDQQAYIKSQRQNGYQPLLFNKSQTSTNFYKQNKNQNQKFEYTNFPQRNEKKKQQKYVHQHQEILTAKQTYILNDFIIENQNQNIKNDQEFLLEYNLETVEQSIEQTIQKNPQCLTDKDQLQQLGESLQEVYNLNQRRNLFGNTSNLVAYYQFNRNFEDSHNQYHLLNTFSHFGDNHRGEPQKSAIYRQDYTYSMQKIPVSIFNNLSEFSLAFWIFKQDNIANDYILSGQSNSYYEYFQLTLGLITLENTSIYFTELQNIVTLNKWYHLVFTIDSTNVKIYVDKVLIETKAHGLTINMQLVTDKLFIGQYQNFSGNINENYALIGKLCNFRIYNTAISLSTVESIYYEEICPFRCQQCLQQSSQCQSCKGDRILSTLNDCICPQGKYDDHNSLNCQQIIDLTNDLKAYYPLNDVISNSVSQSIQETIQGYTGTLHQIMSIPNRFGLADQAFYFAGTSPYTYLDLDYNSINGLQDLTLSFWIRDDTLSPNINIISLYGNSEQMWFSPNNLSILNKNLSEQTIYLQEYSPIKDQQWHQLILVMESNYAQIYVDGVNYYQKPLPNASNLIDIQNGGFIIGQDQDSLGGNFNLVQSFEGGLSDIQIYSKALSQNEIYSLYNQQAFPCVYQCIACQFKSTDCNTCRGDRTLQSGKCLCLDINQFDDSQENCSTCEVQCKGCTNIASNCSQCNDIDIIFRNTGIGEDCKCKNGYYASGQNCIQCSHKCQTCSDFEVCTVCKGNDRSSTFPLCKCNIQFYDNGTDSDCQPCDLKCNGCTGSSTACKACSNLDKDVDTECDQCLGTKIIQGSNCVCPSEYFDDGTTICKECQGNCLTCVNTSTQCVQFCEVQCATCSSNISNCDTCVEGKENPPNCSCSKGFYEETTSGNKDCIPCHETCEECTEAGCTVPKANRILVTNQQNCICPGLNYFDHLNDQYKTNYCTTCDLLVYVAQFTDNFLGITIEFKVPIQIPQQTSDTTDVELCQLLFLDTTYQKLGGNPTCIFDETDTRYFIYVTFGNRPSILAEEPLEFKQDILIWQTVCDPNQNQFFKTFPTSYLRSHPTPLPPSVLLKYPLSTITLCESIEIKIVQIFNDGFRGLKNYKYTLQSTNFTEPQDELQTIIDQQLGNNVLKIPALILGEYSQYSFTLEFTNFVGTIGSQAFEINTSTTYGIQAEIEQFSPFVLNSWKINFFKSNFQYLSCETGQIQEENKQLLIQWQDSTDTNNIQILEDYTSKLTDRQSVYQLEKYFRSYGVYKLQISLQVPGDNNYIKTDSIEYEIIQSELFVVIEGGNRLQSYSEPLVLNGQAYDIDVSEENKYDNIQKTWECINLNTQQECKTIEKNTIDLTQFTDQVEFPKKLFEPYNAFLYTLNGEQIITNKKNQNVAVINIVETALPVLTVNIPSYVLTSKINMNDDIKIDIIYSGDPDAVFFSLALIYKLDVVATRPFSYTTFGFRIWDLFKDFENDQNQLLLRVSLYDPNYFMPSQSSYIVNINFPPIPGTLNITPSEGFSMFTDFQIQIDGFQDDDLPLSYKYTFFLDQQQYQQELVKGNIIQFSL